MIENGRSSSTPSRRTIGWILVAAPTILLLILLLAGWSWLSSTITPVSDFLVEYPLPAPGDKPLNIVAEAPGKLWFTMPASNAIGSLIVTSTTDYRFDLYPVPTSNSTPYDLVFDHARDILWFTEKDANQIAYFEPAGENFVEYPIPTTGSVPTGIDLSQDGTLWFVEQNANQLARFDPGSELFSEFPYLTAGALLEDIAVSNPNSVWFTAPGLERVVRFVPDSNHFLSIPVSQGPGTDPFAALNLVIGSDGLPWVTAPDMNMIGLFVPGTLALWRWYDIPGSDPVIAGLDYSWDGFRHRLWFSESGSGHVGLLVLDATGKVVATRRHPMSSASSRPMGITVDSSEGVWIAEYEGKMIASWFPPYAYDTFVPLLFH
jgi:streptogramin lyase